MNPIQITFKLCEDDLAVMLNVEKDEFIFKSADGDIDGLKITVVAHGNSAKKLMDKFGIKKSDEILKSELKSINNKIKSLNSERDLILMSLTN